MPICAQIAALSRNRLINSSWFTNVRLIDRLRQLQHIELTFDRARVSTAVIEIFDLLVKTVVVAHRKVKQMLVKPFLQILSQIVIAQ
jgi:hypothetical protein